MSTPSSNEPSTKAQLWNDRLQISSMVTVPAASSIRSAIAGT